MNSKQKELLKQLHSVLSEMEKEAVNDDEFNDKLAELNLFNYSLDDINATIYNFLNINN